MQVELKYNTAKARKIISNIQRASPEMQKELKQDWNLDCINFRTLMQDRHLSGGTTVDRLARRSSTLYKSLQYEVKIGPALVNVAIWFLPAVEDYAPTHEYGDESRNIPARMNLGKEWKDYMKKFFDTADKALARVVRRI